MDSILGLAPLIQFFLVFSVFGLIGVLGPALVRRRAKGLAAKEHHDVLGIMFSVAAAFYGVVLAFVIVAAWQNFQEATARERAEALALTEIYVISTRLPPPMQQRMLAALRGYITDALNYEWSGKPNLRAGRQELVTMFNELLALEPQTTKQAILYGKAMDQISRLFEARQERLLYTQNNIPQIVWTVIIFGAVVTIALSFFFFTQHRVLQAVISMLFAMLVGLTIIAIYDLSHPYQGFSRIHPAGFKELLREIDRRTAALAGSQAPSVFAPVR
jgi:FtsH-binding integral membrane protein